jgi:hypothetical protein
VFFTAPLPPAATIFLLVKSAAVPPRTDSAAAAAAAVAAAAFAVPAAFTAAAVAVDWTLDDTDTAREACTPRTVTRQLSSMAAATWSRV